MVYIAPMKALCNERAQDWKKKFAYLNFSCNQLTGDTSYAEMGEVQRSNISILNLLSRHNSRKVGFNYTQMAGLQRTNEHDSADSGMETNTRLMRCIL